MLSRYTEKNKFGGYTWQIKLDSLFHIYINGTDNESFVVEFKEFKWISFKTHFSFVSNKDLRNTIREAYDRVFDFFQGHKDYLWTQQQKNNNLQQTLELLDNSKDPLTKTNSEIQEQNSQESKPINIIRGVGIDDNIVKLTTTQMLIEKYGEPTETVSHNNFSLELKYPKHGMSFFYKLDDPFKIIYFMMATGEVTYETETGLVFDSGLTMEQVLEDYGMGDPRGSDDSDEAYIRYPGIMFYANKDALTQLQADEIYITKIGVLEL